MNGVQKVVCRLLGELDELFEERGIRYCLADKLAWDCWNTGSFSSGYYQACVMVPSDDLERLGALDTPPNRVFVYCTMPQNGRKMARYVAEDTTLLAVDSYAQDAPGICVELYPVEPVSDEGGASQRYEIVTCRPDAVYVDRNPLDPTERKAFEGLMLPLPDGIREYLKTLLGKKWRSQYTLPVETMRYGVVAEPRIPFRDYVRAAEEAGAYDSAIAETACDYERWKATELATTAAALEEQTWKFRMVMARFKMCEKYLPHKRKLLDAWEAGREGDVAFALKDYTSRLKTFYARGEVMHFDDELLDLAVKVLAFEKWPGAEGLADAAKSYYGKGSLSDNMAPYLE